MKKNNRILTIVLVALLSFLFLLSRNSYGLYESSIKAPSKAKIAKWDILIDDEHLNAYGTLRLGNFDFTNNNRVSDSYIAPGAKGTVDFVIDPNDTDVAIKYTIEFNDHTTDPNYLLTITDISFGTNSLIKTAENAYTGIISLDDINDGKTFNVTVEVEWVNDEDNNEYDSQIGRHEEEPMYIDLTLHAIQYTGEQIIPYSGG